MRGKLLLLGLTLFSGIVAAAQSRAIDSLENAVTHQSDTTLIKTYSELVWQYRVLNPAKAIAYGHKAAVLAQRLHFDKGLAQVYNDLGIVYFLGQRFDSALHFYNKSLDLRQQLHDVSGTAKAFNKIGIVYQQSGRFDKALEAQLQALKLFETLNDDIGVSYSLNNIGILNENMRRYDEAIQYQFQSIAIKEKLHDRYGLVGSYVNVANIYTLQKKYDKAKAFYLKALPIARGVNDGEYLSGALNSLGSLLIETASYEEALPYVLESYELRKTAKDKKGVVRSLKNLGDIYKALGKNTDAEEVFLRAVELAKNETSCKPELPSVYKSLSELYEGTGQNAKAVQSYKVLTDLKDSLYSEKLSSRFAELQTEFETEKKNSQIELLGKNNAIKGLQIQNQRLQLGEQKFLLTQNKLELSEASLRLANNRLAMKQQERQLLTQKLEAGEKAKKISELRKQTEIQKLAIENRQLALNRRNIVIAFLVFVFGMVVLLGYSFHRRKQLKEQAVMQATMAAQQNAAAKAVLEAEETERQRIAKDLHDGVGQLMSAARMHLSSFENRSSIDTPEAEQSFQKIIQLVDESCAEVRSVSHNMMPNALLKNNLDAALREFISRLHNDRLSVKLYTEGLSRAIDSNSQTVLYRVIQECVNNAIRHSGATRLDISVVREANELTATVEDNGRGFIVQNATAANGMGLKNIRTRIDYLKGTLEIDSAPGKGTVIAVHVPLEKTATQQ